MKTIVVLMDSLNRHFLSLYGNDWVQTPNIDRFAEKSVTFDNHWLGSAPCMPARRDMMTGRLNFLENDWGPIEPYDVTLPGKLRENDIFTHMVTDHYHYFEIGGENYCQIFNTWDLYRGQESDPWVSSVDKPALPEEYLGRVREQYELNRQEFTSEEEFSGPKTFKAASKWLENNQNAEDFLLWVEAFDPHEPFDTPENFLQLYEDDYDGPRYEWSGYEEVNEGDDSLKHLRNKYAALLTMIDKWFGKLLDVLDENEMWEDTLIVLTTDHGHMLGEHGFTGKNFMHVYNELAHIPLIVNLPGNERAGDRINALTQNIDLMPTILDYFNIDIPETVVGKSWRGLLEGTEDSIREAAIYGYWGKTINVTDGEYTYFRVPDKEDNRPLYRYTGMPTSFRNYFSIQSLKEADMGSYLQWTDVPVYKVEGGSGKSHYHQDNLLFDLDNDYNQRNPLEDKEIETRMKKLMVEKMKDHGAPEEQYQRMGLEQKS